MAAVEGISAIELGDLEFGKQQVAHGGSGAVYKGRWKSRNKTVAIKTLTQGVPEKELRIMSLVSHPNIVHFFGAVLQPPTYCIVTEFVERGSLYDFIHHNELDPERNLNWTKGIASGMKYLHFDVPHGVVIHGDLKSKNVLVTSSFSVKICDFGSSKIREQFAGKSVNTTTNILGTIRWMAPEVLSKKPIGKRCDVYSYGIVVWELLTHKFPFEQINEFQIYNHVVTDRKRPPIPAKCTRDLATLLRKCWDSNPQLRPEFTDIVSTVEKLTTMFIHEGIKKPPLPSKPNMSPHPIPRNVPVGQETDLPPDPPIRFRSLLKPDDKAKSLPRTTAMNIQPPATEPRPSPKPRPRAGTGPPVAPKPGPPVAPKPGPQVGPESRPLSGLESGPSSSPKPGPPVGPKPGPLSGPESRPPRGPKAGPLSGLESVPPRGPKAGPLSGLESVPPRGPKAGPLSGLESVPPRGSKPRPLIGMKPGPPIGPKPAPNRSPSPYRPDNPSDLIAEYESMAEVLTNMKEDQSQQGARPAWSVSADEIEMLDEEVGRGAWGVVKKARFRGMTVAAKCLHKALREEMTDHVLQAFRREMNIAANLRHPNLVLFLGATVEGNLIILNELMDSSLHAVLEKEQLSHNQIVIIASDVARALNYLHSWKPEPLLHRDVSSTNVLLESVGPSSWKAKLSDYGSLQAINLATTLAPGNPTYAAPEALRPGPQSCKMDAYSFGILLMEMCTNQLPNREDLVSLLQVIKWQAMLDLIQICIQDDHHARPTMKEVVKALEHLPQLCDKEIDNPNNIYSEMRWFNPSMTRKEAIEKLITEASDGNFVVRGGGGSMYSLSLYCSGKVYHYRIWENESSDEYYMEEKYQFQTLEELIDYYKQHKGGLLTTLREYSRGKEVEPEVDDQVSVYQVPIVIPDSVRQIPRSELTLSSEVVGRGQYGHVVAGSWEGTSCAIRVAKEEHISAALQCFIVDAVNAMKIFYHQNLVKLYGVCTEGPVLVVTEHLVNGPLDKYLKQHTELVQRKDILLYVATQICSAMKWLEAKGIAHGDLATRNCLVGEQNVVKVADYSLSLYTRPRKPSRTVVTIRWAAPECITQNPKFTTKSDVWSFGIVLYELWTGGKMPYSELRNQDVKSQVLSGYRLERPRTCPHEVYEIMLNCWKLKGEERPRFDDLLQKLKSASNPADYEIVGIAEKTDIAAQLQKLSGERLEIPKSALILGTHHADGSCGYVAAGTWRGLDVAIRVVDSNALREHKESDFLCEAIAILKDCHHENLLKLHGVSTQDGPTFIVTELLTKGSLYNFLQQHSKQLNREILLDMATQICSAMRYLEGKRIIHKDVAARNGLVGERNVVKLADLSLALFTSKRPPVTNVAPIRWAAPEVLQGGPTQFSIKSDVWSFGVFLWELWTGAQTPYSNFINQQVKDKVAKGYKLDKPKRCPQAVYKLMRNCWKMDIENRPSFASLFTDLRALAPDHGLWAHMS